MIIHLDYALFGKAIMLNVMNAQAKNRYIENNFYIPKNASISLIDVFFLAPSSVSARHHGANHELYLVK